MGARIGQPLLRLPPEWAHKSGAISMRYRRRRSPSSYQMVSATPARAKGAPQRIGGCTQDAMSKNMNASAFSCAVSADPEHCIGNGVVGDDLESPDTCM